MTPGSCLALALWIAGSGPACAAPRTTIAVLDFQANNASAGDASVMTDFVRSAVVKCGVYDVVEKKNMDRILAEQAFQRTGCTSEECAVRLGKILNVRKMLVGTYSVFESVRILTMRLVDVQTGRIEFSGSEKGFDPMTADRAADTLVRQMTTGEGAPVEPTVPAAAAPAATATPPRSPAAAPEETDTGRGWYGGLSAGLRGTSGSGNIALGVMGGHRWRVLSARASLQSYITADGEISADAFLLVHPAWRTFAPYLGVGVLADPWWGIEVALALGFRLYLPPGLVAELEAAGRQLRINLGLVF